MTNIPDPDNAREELAKRRPSNDRELWLWVTAVLGYKIPWQPVCDCHQSPFQWLADAFFERKERTLTRGSRDSGKTRMYAILDLLNSHFKPGCFTTHVGSTETQSKDGYAYLSGTAEKHGKPGMVRREPLNSYLADEPMMERTVWTNGSLVRILTGGSSQSVSGPHPQKAVLDEVDHWRFDILNTALLMPRSENNILSQVHLASSQYNSFGTMAGLMVEAAQRGFTLYEWCLFDVMQRCPHCPAPQKDENGRYACPLYQWANPFTGEMEPLCKGRGARSNGHLPYRDACNKFLSVDAETAALQLLLIGGSRNGLVYPAFDDSPYPMGHLRELPDGPLDGWRFWAGVDLRTHSVIECIAQDPRLNHWYFDEWSHDRATPSMVRAAARELKGRWWQQRKIDIEVFDLDPSMPDEADDWQNVERLPGLPAERHPILYGVRLIRNGLATVGGDKTLFVSRRCKRLILEWSKLYHLQKSSMTGRFDPDKPADEENHASDAARYAIASGPPIRPSRRVQSQSMTTMS